ncbi:UbiD family decarboxylase [Pseudonocardia endophytica]|uniref:UbiD family decarboxylase n=1 Tax=Pseudonocardia endophytica TaxID=401976 RepID=A0A4R1HN95_PSEEN|nr:UbiD family decarboxylase [Pseudonocardia endophytica]TCK21830.1 UbiD family decarboxylase [Pseudonocardia endophytica]
MSTGTPGQIDDLRAWLDAARDLGDVRDVRGADWNLEIGAASEVNYRSANPAALLFDSIEGYPDGHRVLTGSMSNARRLALTLRLGSDLDDHALVRALRGKPSEWIARAVDFPPVEVASGPVTEIVESGDDIDLTAFPAPQWHEDDGGRYIGTGCAVFTTDPHTGHVNAGAYRMQVQGPRHATINIEAGKHGAMHVREWFAEKGRCPVTATLGSDPLLVIAAGTEVPVNVSELAYVGAIQGHPVEIVPGQVTGLPVPANAEIVVEGWLHPDRRSHEGPFGEWTGYYSGGGGREEVLELEIERVYRRPDPILLGTPPGKPPHDYSYMRSVMKSSMILDALVATGLPEVRGVWAHEEGGGRQLLAVAIDQKYPGHARQAGLLASQIPAAAYMNKFVIVVDGDVDTRSLSEVMWAVCTRTEPGQDIEVLRRTWGSRVDPLDPGDGPPFNTRAVIDACRPFELLDSFPKVAEASADLCQKVVAKWPDVLGGR